jgi:hypothetical protein
MPPLFPLTRFAPGGVTVATDRPCSRQQASDRIRWAVSQAGGDSSRFSGISARKGRISTAIEAKVDEAILYLQSGHGQVLPARAYMHLTSPDRFLEIPEALGLCLAAAIEISSFAASAAYWPLPRNDRLLETFEAFGL